MIVVFFVSFGMLTLAGISRSSIIPFVAGLPTFLFYFILQTGAFSIFHGEYGASGAHQLVLSVAGIIYALIFLQSMYSLALRMVKLGHGNISILIIFSFIISLVI